MSLDKSGAMRLERLGESRLAIIEQHFMADTGSEYVVDLLQPGKLGFKVTHTPLETAYFRHHAGIWPADMAKQSLRHCLRSSTLSDQSGRARGIAEKHARLRAGNTSMFPSEVHPVKLTFPQFRARET
jgi:hypothetical protein